MLMELKNLENSSMGTVDTLRLERNGRTVPLAQFLSEYKKDGKTCYGFVEGKDDLSYYKRAINNMIEQDCCVILYPSNGKENVKYIFEKIHENKNVSNERIVYFMDRDLSNIIDDNNLIIDSYVYITDNYSFENDILNSDTLGIVMQELLSFNSLSDIEKVKSLYENQLLRFEDKMLPIMAHMVIWKKNNIQANIRNFKIGKLFKVNDGSLSQIVTDEEIIKKLYKDCHVDYPKCSKTDIDDVIRKIQKASLIHQIVRGKYLATFFIMFCNSVFIDYSRIGIGKPINNGNKLSEGDIMKAIVPRARSPKSLKRFIEDTIVKYFNKMAA